LPPEAASTKSVIIRPMPVSVTAPTIRPALAQATAMPIMLRAPTTSPRHRSAAPRDSAAPTPPSPRNAASSAGCSSTIAIEVAVAQNADVAGDSSSTVRHQSSTTIGTIRCSPERRIGQGRGRCTTGAAGSSIGMSG
jgi:hypothetical protein